MERTGTLRLMLTLFFLGFIATSPLWLKFPYTDNCITKIRDPCINGVSKLCDTEELCCRTLNSTEATIIPGQFIFVNCTNSDTVISTCNNGVLSNLNNCTLLI